ncbi:MAG TPA: SprT family zinc-dependent metalloprotease [Candidatus Saccharimonadales bacterium]|nr:SprT family zinc-dependent metalloprotease [Candidatus Saccharimonadales bacterium]
MSKNQIEDPEFGVVKVRRSHLANRLKLKVDQSGKLQVSMPLGVPLFFAKRFIDESRDFVRKSLSKVQQTKATLRHGDLIGKTHKLHIGYGTKFSSKIVGTTFLIEVPKDALVESAQVQDFIKQEALKALRLQSKAYLSRRLKAVAEQYGFSYTKLRFANAGTRWGSCSSSGTISLNIWLMQLPLELIDYVIVHELCHTRELNHSANFWSQVEIILPNFKQLRSSLKQQQPYL